MAYKNADLTPEKRAADLVSRMTLEEKVLAPLEFDNTAGPLTGVTRDGSRRDSRKIRTSCPAKLY